MELSDLVHLIRQFAIFGLTLGLALGFLIFTVIVILYATSWVVIAGYCLTTVLISDGSIASRMAAEQGAQELNKAVKGKSRTMLSPRM
ncbi:unnamed protein product [Orchesella dallaii]|uniref:Uncharacterized protein n=1 Tax=Orchesella dallaii TaxID=48710 RepID=A0ABP1QLC5_9HEXA